MVYWKTHQIFMLFTLGLLVSCGVGCSKKRYGVQLPHLDKEQGQSSSLYRYDLGKILAGEKRKHRFQFRNTSDESLFTDEVAGVKKSCQCAGVSISRNVLAPDEVSEIEIAVDSANKVGNFSERVVVVWKGDSGKELIVVFELLGDSLAPFIFFPTQVGFSRENIASSEDFSVTVQSDETTIDWNSVSVNPSIEYLVVTEVTPSVDGVTFHIAVNKDKIDTGGVYEVTVTADGVRGNLPDDVLPSTYVGKFLVHIDNPEILKVRGDSVLLTRSSEPHRTYDGHFFIEGDFSNNFKDAPQITVDELSGYKIQDIMIENLAKTVVQVSFSLEPTNSSNASVADLPMKVTLV